MVSTSEQWSGNIHRACVCEALFSGESIGTQGRSAQTRPGCGPALGYPIRAIADNNVAVSNSEPGDVRDTRVIRLDICTNGETKASPSSGTALGYPIRAIANNNVTVCYSQGRNVSKLRIVSLDICPNS